MEIKETKKFIPTGSLETYLPLYRELYKKFYDEYKQKQDETEGGKLLNSGKGCNSRDHFDYYLIRYGWEEIKRHLDKPLIEAAKYKVGDKIKFIKEKWVPKGTSIEEHDNSIIKNVECEGEITEIFTHGMGTGEIWYAIENCIPECWESNPYATEKNVIEVINN